MVGKRVFWVKNPIAGHLSDANALRAPNGLCYAEGAWRSGSGSDFEGGGNRTPEKQPGAIGTRTPSNSKRTASERKVFG